VNHRIAVAVLVVVAVFARIAAAKDDDAKLYQTTTQRAVKFLTLQQGDDGAISGQRTLGPTAIAVLAMLRTGRGPSDPTVAKGLKYLEEYVQETGGIHKPGGMIPVYETCISLMCFKQANRDGRYNKILKDAEAFLRKGQIDEASEKDKSDMAYGGIGYGGRSRPDLSNTAYLIDALKAAGAEANDPALQKALVFVSRCQNLESEHNTSQWAAKVNDGGFAYTPVLEHVAREREAPGGGLRSYASMTYSGLKSMIYAGLNKNDPRVKAALAWIGTHYDLGSNPGMGDAGLYYYYHTFAKALDATGVDEFTDAKGVRHNWRHDLLAELARRQRPDGSWVNTNTEWMEGDPGLATAFSLLALSYCKPVEK
jgi:hypothetical protein